jgi:hypothetical protein
MPDYYTEDGLDWPRWITVAEFTPEIQTAVVHNTASGLTYHAVTGHFWDQNNMATQWMHVQWEDSRLLDEHALDFVKGLKEAIEKREGSGRPATTRLTAFIDRCEANLARYLEGTPNED